MPEPVYEFRKGVGWVPSFKGPRLRQKHSDSDTYPLDLDTVCTTCDHVLGDHFGSVARSGGVTCDPVYRATRLFTW